MKLKSLFIFLLLLVPSTAFAQYYGGPRGGGGYYAAPPRTFPGGFHDRTNRLIFGFSLGLGGMSDKGGDLECSGCTYNPLAGQVSGHIGGFVGPRLALMAELQGNVQTIAQDQFGDGIDTSLVQVALMGAAQYWLTPQLWIKGGIGFASLQVQDEDFFGVVAASRPENGVALMGAVGFELLSSKYFSVDLQGRVINGSYKQLDNHVTSATVGIGINWF